MVLYSENPKLKFKKIETFNGKTEYIKNCKKIDDKFYLTDVDCINIGGRWHTKDDPNLLLDYETKEFFYNKARGRRMYGIVDVAEDKSLVYGYFSPNLYNNVKFMDGNVRATVMAINSDIFKKCPNFLEHIAEGVWYFYPELNKKYIDYAKQIKNIYDWTVKSYNIEQNTSEFATKMREYEVYPHPIRDCHTKFSRFLDYTFGFEFEVQQGFVPDNMQYRHGVVPCRDGSINGGAEYVTIPQKGAKGLCSLESLCKNSKFRVILDIHCSMHTHLGGFPEDMKSIAALYFLCTKIQEDIFDMLPPYKRHWEGFKKKNYCKELDMLGITVPETFSKEMFDTYTETSYNKIFNFASDFKMERRQFHAGDKHPSGAKWDIENRKTWVNFINIFFSERKTIEFRAHQATFNEVKTINWLFICNAVLKYAHIHSTEILSQEKSISLEDVVNIYKTLCPNDEDAIFLSDYLNAYISSRKKEFKDAMKERKDFACNWDLNEDRLYDFKVLGKNLFD